MTDLEKHILESAKEIARQEGVPEHFLDDAKGLFDLQAIKKKWKEHLKDEEYERKRKAADMPSLRDLTAHRER